MVQLEFLPNYAPKLDQAAEHVAVQHHPLQELSRSIFAHRVRRHSVQLWTAAMRLRDDRSQCVEAIPRHRWTGCKIS